MLAELGAQQQKRHAEEIELEQSAMKARLSEEREAYQQELAVHKETAAEIARLKAELRTAKVEASEARAIVDGVRQEAAAELARVREAYESDAREAEAERRESLRDIRDNAGAAAEARAHAAAGGAVCGGA